MKLIVKFILIGILASCLNSFAQTKAADHTENTPDTQDTIKHYIDTTYEWTRGLRIGVNLVPFIDRAFSPYPQGLEFTVDTRIKLKFYGVAEFGYENNVFDSTYLTYRSSGKFARIGVDYNMRSSDVAGNDVFYVGARYGFSYMTQQVTGYTLTDSIWGNSNPKLPFNTTSCYTHWLEFLIGIHVELVKNLYLGWSMRSKFMLVSNHTTYYPQYIPGYGDGSSSVNFGFTYSLSYQFPLMKVRTKKRIKIAEEPEPEDDTSTQTQQSNQMMQSH